jgi:hypothetical protein
MSTVKRVEESTTDPRDAARRFRAQDGSTISPILPEYDR